MRRPLVLAFVLVARVDGSRKQGCWFSALRILGLALGPGDGWHGSKAFVLF